MSAQSANLVKMLSPPEETITSIKFNPDEQIVPEFEVRVANSATTGISSEELNVGGDQIKFPVRLGETATKRSVQLLSEHDAGMLVLICR